MRLVKVSVRNFQAVERADVEFARGLNILFGPNDLGKSTVASAIRAALLVPPSSAEANRYMPWFVDAVPEVTLEFTDDDNHIWRIHKTFGAASASADLYHSKDGITFTRDRGGREVEEQLRNLLGWGVASPGGKGAPRKLPTSFLAHVLIADQSEVVSIFEQSTEADGATSGRDRLRKALSALAEDPWFKKVLVETQKKVDGLFTPTGQRKRGRGSPFAMMAEDVERRSKRVDELRKGAEESRATEDSIARAREACEAAREAAEEAATALLEIRKQRARMGERALAEERFAQAKAVVDGLNAQAKDVDAHDALAKELETTARKAAADLADAHTASNSAAAKLRDAEDALRTATSEDGARQREIARAKLGEERAETASKTTQAEKGLENLESVLQAVIKARDALKASADAQRESERVAAATDAAKKALVEAETELELARGIAIYGQWKEADAAATKVADAKEKVTAARAEAAAKDAAAEEAERKATQIEAEAKSVLERLPNAELANRVEELQQGIAIAEAALGGGISLAVRGSGKVPVYLTIDGNAMAGTAIDGRVVFEADRTVHLRLGQLLEVEIVAGAAEKRRAIEVLKARWTSEAEPILERAAVKSPTEIRERLGEVSVLQATALAHKSDAKNFRIQAEAARQSAVTQEQRGEALMARAREAEALTAKVGTLDTQILAAGFAKLGAAWESQVSIVVAAKEKAATLAREQTEKGQRALDLAEYQAAEASKAAKAAQLEAARLWGLLAIADVADAQDRVEVLQRTLATVGSEISTLKSRHSAIEDEMNALENQASSAVSAAKSAVEAAKVNRARALERQEQAGKALGTSQSAFHTARGTVEGLRKSLEKADRAGAEADMRDAGRELERYSSDPLVSAEQVELAERCEANARIQLDQLRGDLHKAEGALTKVGGVGLREELAREEDAYERAKERQRELEIDSDAWQLLRETLDLVEKEGSTHLGRSLAAPISARLAELTRGRYSGLRLDQHLRAEAVDVPQITTDADVLSALSVGTRDQIATLLRLTIAEQLKSAVVLDDHLVHTDPDRLAWFRDLLRETALTTQVIVLTCRPHDYLTPSEHPETSAFRDLAGGMVRAIDATQVVRRWRGSESIAEQ